MLEVTGFKQTKVIKKENHYLVINDSKGKENKPRAKKQPIFRDWTLGIIMTKWDLANKPVQGCSEVQAHILRWWCKLWHKSLESSLVYLSRGLDMITIIILVSQLLDSNNSSRQKIITKGLEITQLTIVPLPRQRELCMSSQQWVQDFFCWGGQLLHILGKFSIRALHPSPEI